MKAVLSHDYPSRRSRPAFTRQRDAFTYHVFAVLIQQNLPRRLRSVATSFGPSPAQRIARRKRPPSRLVHRWRPSGNETFRSAEISSNDRPSPSRNAFDPV